MVGKVGADPTTSFENGFTVRRGCRFATCPYKGTQDIPDYILVVLVYSST